MKFSPGKRLMKSPQKQSSGNGADYLLRGFLLLNLLLFILSGCKPVPVSWNPVSIPQSTNHQKAIPSQTPPHFVIPTATITPALEPVSWETYLYTHPDELFTLQAPKNWVVSHNPFDVTFTAPRGGQQIFVHVVNTGYVLEDEAFERLIENRETENAYKYDSYVEIQRQNTSKEHSKLISKSFFDSGKMKVGETFYQVLENMVIIIDYWVDEENFSINQNLFEKMHSSIQLNEAYTGNQSIYLFDQAALHSNGYFSILVPSYWDFRRIEEDHTVVETFTSPDEQAIIQTLIYDDGKPMTMSVAGELTLGLLRNNYTTFIKLLQDEMLRDGREKLTWSSYDNSYQGTTSFAVQGTAVYIFTVMWGSDPDLHYQNVLDSVFLSYNPEVLSE